MIVPKVPFNIDISTIGASLQLSNFQYVYSVMYGETCKNKKKDRKYKDFHSGMQLLTQLLYIIRDMASSEDERNKKNAQILQQNVFYHDLCRVSKAGISLYEEGKHSKQFLHDSIEFTALMTDMLEEYSKGKVLTIQTQKKKKVKKDKKERGDSEDEEYNAANDYNDDPIEDQLSIDEESDDETSEKFVERQFNFVSEISIFVDYTVISRYLQIIRDKDYRKNPLLLQAVIALFKRIMNQVRATWIFFQFEYMLVFQQVLNEGSVNNSLMKGINLNGPATTRVRQIEALMSELKQIFVNIVRQYLDVFQKNKLLGVECFFRFASREHKDSILNNYENLAPTSEAIADEKDEDEYQHQDDSEPEIAVTKKKEEKVEDQLKKVWT